MDINDLIDSTLNDQFSDVDVFEYITTEEQASMLRELVAVYASYQYDNTLTVGENASERISAMSEYLEKAIYNLVWHRVPAEALEAA